MNATYFDDVFFGPDNNHAAGIVRSDSGYVWIHPVGVPFPEVALSVDVVISIVATAEPTLKADHVEEIADILGIPKVVAASTPSDVAAVLCELTADDMKELRGLVYEKKKLAYDTGAKLVASSLATLCDKLDVLCKLRGE